MHKHETSRGECVEKGDGGAAAARVHEPGGQPNSQCCPEVIGGHWHAPLTGSHTPPLRHAHSDAQPAPNEPTHTGAPQFDT